MLKVYLATFPTDDVPRIKVVSAEEVQRMCEQAKDSDHTQDVSAIAALVEKAGLQFDGDRIFVDAGRDIDVIAQGKLELDNEEIPICYAMCSRLMASASVMLFDELLVKQ